MSDHNTSEECNVCGENHFTLQCPLLGGLAQKVEDKTIPSRARLTLPNNLCIEEENGASRVVAKEVIPVGTQFGPVEAPRVRYCRGEPRFLLKVFPKQGRPICLDTSDENQCNWMCYVTPAKNLSEQNLIAYQLNQDVYFSVQKEIHAGETLLVGYSPPYGRKILGPAAEETTGAPSGTVSASFDVKAESQDGTVTVRRKRGRPPRTPTLPRVIQKSVKGELESEDTTSLDNSVSSDLDASDLGVTYNQQEWTCSQCGSVYSDCIMFARHLQDHYRPVYLKSRGSSRGRGRGRGRRRGRGWHSGRGRARGYGWSRLISSRLSKDTGVEDSTSAGEEVEAGEFIQAADVEGSQMIQEVDLQNQAEQHPSAQDEIQTVSVEEALQNVEQEAPRTQVLIQLEDGSLHQITSFSQSLKFDGTAEQTTMDAAQLAAISKSLPNQTAGSEQSVTIASLEQLGLDQLQLTFENPLVTAVPVKTTAKRGRKRKGEALGKEDMVIDKQFKCVTRQSASGKYNFRKTRKVLVVSDEENEDEEVDEEEEETYDDYEDEYIAPLPRDLSAAEAEQLQKSTEAHSSKVQVPQQLSEHPSQSEVCTSNDADLQSAISVAAEMLTALPSSGGFGPGLSMPVVTITEAVAPQLQNDLVVQKKDSVSSENQPYSAENIACVAATDNIQEQEPSLQQTENGSIEEPNGTVANVINTIQEASVSKAVISSISERTLEAPEAITSVSKINNIEENPNNIPETGSNNVNLTSAGPAVEPVCLESNVKDVPAVSSTENQANNFYKDPKNSEELSQNAGELNSSIQEVMDNNVSSSQQELENRVVNEEHEQMSENMETNDLDMTQQAERQPAEEQAHETDTTPSINTRIIHAQKNFQMLQSNLMNRPKRPGRFKCDLCGKGFNKTLYLYRHIKKHTGEFTCSKCRKVFARKENMLKHNCLTGPEEQVLDFHCGDCGKVFATDRLLKRHMAKHTGEYTCNDCGKSYSTKDILLNHSCIAHPSAERYSCGVCGRSFTRHTYLMKHLPVHTGQHSCPICGKWLRSSDSLTNHLRMCGQVKEIEVNGKATCSHCHTEFTDVVEFRKHQYEHTHMHICEMCGARFRNLVSMNMHVCHGQPIDCDVCGKVFESVAEMEQHRSSHGKPLLKCNTCQKRFYRKDALSKHICELVKKTTPTQDENEQKVYYNLMPLICEICGSMFSSTSSLNVHRNLHGEKKFSCEVCGKRFHRKDLLIEHHAVHGDPTFPCRTCFKLFKTKKSLDVHMMIHDGIKRFKCSTCGKEFYQKGNLLKHEETHVRDRKYVCSICQKAFSTKEYLNVHVLEHTRGKIFTCGICGRSFVKEHQLRSHHRMFHSNQIYVCKYCNLGLKLRHSLKRHLFKKHPDKESEWRSPDFVNKMLVTKAKPDNDDMSCQAATQFITDSESQLATDSAQKENPEVHLLPEIDQEVLLAVTSFGSQELREAIESGRAQIKQGPTPNTIEISVPLPMELEGETTAASTENQITFTNLMVPDESEESNRNSNEVIHIEANQSDENAQHFIMSQNSEENISVEHTEGEAQQQYITLPLYSSEDVSSEAQQAAQVLEEAASCVEGQVAEGGEEQHIVIAGQELADGSHHIVYNETNIEERTVPHGTILLEDGTILQQEEDQAGPTDLLLYVLTTSETQE